MYNNSTNREMNAGIKIENDATIRSMSKENSLVKWCSGFLLLLLLTLCGVQTNAQNSFNSGDGWGAGWGTGSSFSSSAGSSLIYTTTNTLGGNVNRYFRLYGNGTPCGEYGPSGAADVLLSAETAYTSSTITCGSAKAFYVVVPNTTDNWVFKTNGVSSQQLVIFRVQGAVRTISAVSQSPSSNVRPGQSVSVSATMSGAQSTGQNYYLRYSTDNFTTSTVVAMTVSSTTATGTIPALAEGVAVKYYVFTSGTTTPTHSDADFRTINLNNNSGSNYSYTVAAPAQYTWNQTGTAAYGTSTNWTPNRTTALVSDLLIFNNGANTTVTGVPTESIGSLQVSANTTVNLQPTTTNTLTINDYVTGSDLTVASGSKLTLATSLTLTLPTGAAGTINGTLTNAGTVTTNSNLTFSSTGTYEHNYTTAAGVIPTATWSTGSTCSVIGYASSALTFSSTSGLGQTFSNFTWNCPSQTVAAQLNGYLTTVNGTLNFVNTGTGVNNIRLGTTSANFTYNYGSLVLSDTITLTGSGAGGTNNTGVTVVNISGDLTLSGAGLLDFNTLANAASSTVNLSGNLSMTGTSGIKRSSSATSTLNFIKSSGTQTLSIAATCTIAGPITYNIGNGTTTTNTVQLLSNFAFSANANSVIVLSGSTLDLQGYIISGASSSFTTNSGSILKIGHASGITASAASGGIQVGTRTYGTGANYIYSGTADQATGDGLPSTINTLTIANTGSSNNTVTVTNTGTLAISSATAGALTLTSGFLKLQASTDTISIASTGGITATSGDFSSSSVGGVKFLGTGTVTGTVNFYPAVVQAPSTALGVTYSSGSTIQNSLTLRANSFIVASNAPNYATNSTLIYNIGTSYGRSTEWSATSGRGYPFNVTVKGSTTLDVVNSVNSYKKIAGTLTVESGSTLNMQTLTTGNGSGVGLEVVGNVVNDGTISLNAASGSTTQRLKCVNFTNGNSNSTATTTLSSAVGGDLEVTGNLTDNANFTANNRAVFFSGTGTQTIGGTASGTFNVDYIVSNKASGSVKILKDLLTEGPNGGNAITLTNATDIFDLNGYVLTAGKASVSSTFSGSGKFKGGSNSGMIINGTGSFGTLNFDVTTPGTTNLLSTFTVNRTSTGTLTLGSDLNVGTTLTLTSGVISTGSNNLIVNSGATVSRTSGHVNGNLQKTAANGANSFEIGSATVYAPASVNMSGVSGSVVLTGKATSGNPTTGSNINQSKKSNHYWNITKTGAGTFTGYDATFDFTNTTNTGTTSAYKVNKYDGSWANVTSSVSGTTITATGLTSFSDFEVGELLTPSVTSSAATSITSTGATLNGTVNANGYSSTVTFNYGTTSSYGSSATAAQSPVTGTSNTSVSASISSLSVNTQYNFTVSATNTYGTSSGSNLTFYTLANTPGTPTVNNTANAAMDVTLDANGNPSNTQFAIQETSTGNYVQADGSLGATAAWQTAASWGTKTVTGLSGGTTYTFQVKARNGDNTETSFSATASGTTTSSVPPTVTSSSPTNIAATTVDLGGNVTSDGGATITERGVVWSYTSLNNDPLIGGANVTKVTGTGTTGAFSVNVTGLSSITQISFKAYATNSQGTTYSSVATFTTTASAPTTQATSIAFSSITTNTMNVSWTNGDGGNRAVFMKAGSGAITNPVNGTSYNASSNWASLGTQLGTSGYYCIYNGTGNSVSLTGLSAGTQYYVQVFEYNADGSNTASSINYLTSTATGNPGNAATLSLEPLSHAASFSAAVASSTSINLSFSAASTITNAAGYIILQSTGSSAPTGTPADATGYAVGNSIGDGTVAAIVTNTASTSTTISGLSAATQYSFVLIPFGYNGSVAATYNYYVGGTIPSATATTYATTPSAQPTALSATSVVCNGMTVSWTAASGSPSGYIVLRSSGATAPNTDPVIGTSYSQGSTLGNATVAYVGSAVSFANTSLSDNTTYRFKIYSYNGSGVSIAYNTTSPLTGSQLTSSVSAPTATTASNISANSFTANWNAATCATGYSLYVGSSIPDTVAAWTWPTLGTLTYSDSTASFGTPNYGNSNFSISSGTQVDYSGVTTRAAGGTAWNSIGKFYQVIVNTTGYANLTVSSAHQSSGSGPKDFQLEYKIGSGGTWTAVSGGTIASGSSVFTNLSNVSLPSACNNQTQVYLRWVTTSLLRADQTTPGNTTASGGTNRIDDIYIKGTLESTVSGFNPATVTGSSATVTGLAPLATYSYYLTSTAANSSSSASNSVSATTTADPATADFRTKASGNFTNAAIWQYKYDGVNWGDAPQAPSSGNNITIQSTDSVFMNSDLAVNTGKTFTVNGKIDLSTRVISGSGTFILSPASSVFIGNATGLTGALTITNTTRDAAANYIFNGTIAQTAGFLPATLTGNVIIDNPYGVTLISNKTLNTPGTLTVKANAALAFGTGTTTSAYNFNGTGNFVAQTGSTLTITNSSGIVNDGSNGSIRLSGTRTFASGVNYVFAKNDATNQSKTGASFGTEITSVNNLSFNNPLGSRLNSNITVNGTLNLVSGRLNTDAYAITLASGGSLTKSDTSWVVGSLVKNVAAGSPTVNYEVGPDSLTYTPVSLAFNTVSTAGAVAVTTTKAAQPNLSSSVLSITKRLNYYVGVSGAAVFTNYTATLTYTASNVLGSASTSALVAGRYNSGWSYPSMGTRTSTSAPINSITGYGDLALGELNCTLAASASNNGPVCSGNNIQLTGSSTGGYGTKTYSWSGPSSYSSSSQNPVISSSSSSDAGVYSLTVTDSAGCQSTTSTTVVITPQPAMPTLACYETATFNTTTCAWVVTGSQPTMPTLACYETASFNTTTCAWVVTGSQPTMPTLACYQTASFNTTTCAWVVSGSQPTMPTLACYETATFNTTTCAWVVTGSQPTMPTLACYQTASFNTTTCAWDVTGTQPTMPTLACYETASFNTTTCAWVVTGTQPTMPTLACYETASFNTTTCAWVVTGSQPTMPTLACYETATFNTTTCAWVVTGSQPTMPTLACYQTATFNTTTCAWVVTGSQPTMPTLACYETASFNTTTCAWVVTGTQPTMPTLACYETASFNTTTCAWVVSGSQPTMPTLACYETASFNTTTCAWVVSGSQPTMPTLACYETASFNTTTCAWVVTGSQPTMPTLACYETASFNTTTCAWVVSGSQPTMPTLACYETASFNTTTCAWVVTGSQPTMPTLACYETASFNTTTCAWVVTGSQPTMPTLACYETASFNTTTCAWVVTGTQPTMPTLACYETASFNTTTCAWVVTGSQPTMPTLACYETASFNTTTCAWVVTGSQPTMPTLACYETASFNTTTCAWVVSGSQPTMPTLACYETASFNTTTCAWVVTGSQPTMPTLACYETASFNTTTCAWVVTGSQPTMPTLACYETASFNTTTCAWVVTGTQPTMPTLACYETASFNTTTCAWVVTGSQPTMPTLACYETASFNTTTCAWDVTGTQPTMPTLACYETASFNTTTCAWVVTGTQPTMPTLACYETASFNTTTCAWVVTGSQPTMPTLACYETASFNTTTCAWVVTGTQPTMPTLACYETASFNTTTCAWVVTGSQPTMPTLACYETASFNTTTCAWVVTGTQPTMPTLACYETASFNTTTCAWVVTGSQPTMPTLACYETASFNTTTCAWVVTGSQPTMPTLACYETASFNTTTCAWVVSGSQPTMPTLACYETASFNTTTCAWVVTGSQPTMPTLACYETASFNTTTCAWVVTGSQPTMPTLACYETASFNTTTCAWVVTGTQPTMPTLACYETASFNTTTCAWVVTGSQPTMPTLACYETASFNTTTCAWDVTGTQPTMPTLACYETASFNTTTCAWVVTGTQPTMPTLACYETASFNTTTCAWVVTGSQPTMPTLACYETASFNTTTCAWVVTGTQPTMPTLACYETASFNTTTCAWVVTGSQPTMPTLACYETASFNTTTCAWVVTGSQPTMPTLACYETASFNTTTCAWVVTGSQPTMPTLACYETASFNTTTCAWVVTGSQPTMPTLACYETASFNTTTCAWVVTGTQPTMPTLACYETASFNTTTCAWVVTGTQPTMPTLACYETASFNTTTCVWDVTGTQPTMPTLACYETASFNTATCAWVVTGTQPTAPTGLACYETANFNTTTCAWVVTGSQPTMPTLACYQTASFNTTTCAWVVTGSQPTMPTLACYETASFNTTTCAWVVTGTQPTMPTLACYETASFNTTTCAWVVTGSQPTMPTLACYQTASFNTTTCAWVVTGSQPTMPTLACYETASFNTTTCVWDVTGSQPTMPTLACYETASFNTATCAWVVTGTQPTAPTGLACYETANFNTTTCAWVVTGSQPTMPTLACYQTASFNTTTCVWDVTGSQPTMPTLACYQTASFNTTTCVWVVTGTQPTMPTLACYETASFNTTTCAWVVTGSQPTMPTLACYETASFNTTTCAWVVTGSQPTMPTLACYQTASFNTTTCAWVVTGSQPTMPTLACYQTASFNTTTCAWVVTGTAPAAIVTTTSSCNTYTWSANGQSYTQSGTYSYNANCQDYVLNLTIKLSTSSSTPVFVCSSQVPYSWNGGSYSTSGTYSYTTTNAANCDSVATLVLTVGASIPTAVSSVTQPTCSVATGSIVVTSPIGSGLQYSIGGAYQSSTTFSGLAAGTYSLTVKNLSGCFSTPASVTVNAQPIVPGVTTVTGQVNVCNVIGTNTALSYTASAPGATSYTWTLPPNTTLVSGQGTATISVKFLSGFATQANKQIRVVASSTCGSNVLKVYYLAAQLPVTPSTIVPSTTNVCPSIGTNVPITYTIAKVSGAASYIWNYPSTMSVTHPNGLGENDTVIAVTFASNYTSNTITVQAVNSCGTSTSRTIFVTRNNPSTPSIISGPTNACEYIGTTGVNATYSVTAAANVETYAWTLPAGATNVAGQGTNTITFRYPAGYTGGTISVTATNGCGTSSSRTLAVSRLVPATPGNIDVINPSGCPNRVYTYSIASLPGNATSTEWSVPTGGTIVSGQGTTSITVSYISGVVDGQVSVRGINNCGASSYKTSIVKLAPCPAGPATTIKGLPIVANDPMEVKVFPNPTTSNFNLQVITADKQEVVVRILDVQGRFIKSVKVAPYQTLNIGSELKSGSYMLEVRQGNNVKTTRVVKY